MLPEAFSMEAARLHARLPAHRRAIARAMGRVREALAAHDGMWACCVSGGKDSTALVSLAVEAGWRGPLFHFLYRETPEANTALVTALGARYGLQVDMLPVTGAWDVFDRAGGFFGHGENGAAPQGKPAHKDWVWRIHERFNRHFENFRSGYEKMLSWALEFRAVTIVFFVCLFAVSLILFPFIGRDFFPQVDAGQFRLHVRTVAGTRIEEAERTFGQVEDYIRQVVPKDEMRLVIDNIGLPVGGVNLAFSDSATIGSTDGEIQVSLSSGHKTPVWTFIRRLRRELPARFPGVVFYFQPADIVSQILNFGLPAPVDLQVVGRDKSNYLLAHELAAKVAKIPGAVDVNVHQLIDAPQFNIDMDRQRAIELGLTANDVANSLLISLSSSGQTARNYWVNPQNGVNYLVAVQTPQYQVSSLNDLTNIPIVVAGQKQSQLLSNLATFKRDVSIRWSSTITTSNPRSTCTPTCRTATSGDFPAASTRSSTSTRPSSPGTRRSFRSRISSPNTSPARRTRSSCRLPSCRKPPRSKCAGRCKA